VKLGRRGTLPVARSGLWRGLGFVVRLGAVLLLPGCETNPCLLDETVHLKITGTCTQNQPTLTLDLRQESCRLYLSAPTADAGVATLDASASPSASATSVELPFPATGALDAEAHPIREGGWQLWGCPNGREPCPGRFRVCTAVREAWQLNVTCEDDTGAAVCRAVLTE